MRINNRIPRLESEKKRSPRKRKLETVTCVSIPPNKHPKCPKTYQRQIQSGLRKATTGLCVYCTALKNKTTISFRRR